MNRLLLAVFSVFAMHAMAEDPKAGIRAMTNPDTKEFYEANRLYLDNAIHDANQQLVPRLDTAESITIYSLSPERLDDSQKERTDRHYFHGYKILGCKTIWRSADLASWRSELIEGLRISSRVLCFEPRHAIRVHTRRTTTDMILCFQCGHMLVFGIGTRSHMPSYFFDREVYDALNQFLDTNGIQRDTPER